MASLLDDTRVEASLRTGPLTLSQVRTRPPQTVAVPSHDDSPLAAAIDPDRDPRIRKTSAHWSRCCMTSRPSLSCSCVRGSKERSESLLAGAYRLRPWRRGGGKPQSRTSSSSPGHPLEHRRVKLRGCLLQELWRLKETVTERSDRTSAEVP